MSTAADRLLKLGLAGADELSTEAFSRLLDDRDELSELRNAFNIPQNRIVVPTGYAGMDDTELDQECAYFAGNSLGLMPKSTIEYVKQELEVWGANGVMGHHSHPHKRPWIEIDEIVTSTLAELIGAKTSEVACMGTLTSNLHQLLTSFYKPTATRHKILYEGKAFPSDQYAFASQVETHDFPPTSLLPMDPLPGEYVLRTEEILKVIEEEGESIAVICFGAIQYYSGEFFDMQRITAAGQAKGCLVAFDLAHAIGNVPMSLHEWGVDFAMWCSYKYLCSGPGGIAGLYVHERHSDRPRLAGWWGHESSTRFAMPPKFVPSPGAAGFQLSNPSVLDVISLYSSLEMFKTAGEHSIPKRIASTDSTASSTILEALRRKSIELTTYLEFLLVENPRYLPLDKFAVAASQDTVHFTIITPLDPQRRGAQLSILFSPADRMQDIFERLREQGVLADERKPGVIRLSPVPLYNSFADVFRCAKALSKSL